MRQRRLGEEGHAWRAQRTPDVHAGLHVREFLGGADVDARIVERAPGEDQPPALDVETAAERRILAFDDAELP